MVGMARRTALSIDIALTVAAFALIAIAVAILPGQPNLLMSVLCATVLAIGFLCTMTGLLLSIYLLVSERPRCR
jgi:hypothetical protein